MKKQIGYLVLLVISISALAAQQITRFAVVDTAQVYNTFFRDSTAVRNYEAKKLEFQNEITRLTEELRTLQLNKVNLEKSGDMTAVIKLETEISRRAGFLTEYTKAKNFELDTLKKRLNSDDDFYIAFYDALGRIAESDGYSLVLSLQDANAVLWYSPTVNITEKVIARLRPSQQQ
jgi:outer membrane protein